jgi:hypothetical protein
MEARADPMTTAAGAKAAKEIDCLTLVRSTSSSENCRRSASSRRCGDAAGRTLPSEKFSASPVVVQGNPGSSCTKSRATVVKKTLTPIATLSTNARRRDAGRFRYCLEAPGGGDARRLPDQGSRMRVDETVAAETGWRPPLFMRRLA